MIKSREGGFWKVCGPPFKISDIRKLLPAWEGAGINISPFSGKRMSYIVVEYVLKKAAIIFHFILN